MSQDMSIDTFKEKLSGGGARSNLFKVTLTGLGSAEIGTYLCKATALPASTVGPIDVPFRGRVIKVSGDRTFEEWTVTIINDLDFGIRNDFEKWMNDSLNKHEGNTGDQAPASYKKDMQIEQLAKDGSVIKSYFMKGCFPTNVGEIEVSYDSTDTIEEFDVTLAYDYWASDTTDGDGGSSGATNNAGNQSRSYVQTAVT